MSQVQSDQAQFAEFSASDQLYSTLDVIQAGGTSPGFVYRSDDTDAGSLSTPPSEAG